MHNKPGAAVLMPVYNGEQLVGQAIESILNQTYSNYEFIIVDDGSTDNTARILEQYARQDGRIKIVRSAKNLKQPGALNLGLYRTQADLVMRMDADDTAQPERLATLVMYMRQHPDISVCGSGLSSMDGDIVFPLEHEQIKTAMLFQTGLGGALVIFRTEEVIKAGGYCPEYIFCEDYELWVRLSMQPGIRFANIPSVLYNYRGSATLKTPANVKVQTNNLVKIFFKNLLNLQIWATGHDITLHTISSGRMGVDSPQQLEQVRAWLSRLSAANIKCGYYNQQLLEMALARHFQRVLQNSKQVK